MIKVNLCPADELESQYWYLPDLVVLAACFLGAYFGVQNYIDGMNADIQQLSDEATSLETGIQELAPELKKIANLQTEIDNLNRKISALKDITVSKISRYKPVIVMEHLQNIKPEGAWYQTLTIGRPENQANGARPGQPGLPPPGPPAAPASGPGRPTATPTAQEGEAGKEEVTIVGYALDNLLTAELLTAMRATENQDADESDLRTLIYFTGLSLEIAEESDDDIRGFGDMRQVVKYTIRAQFKERGGAAKAEAPPPLADAGPGAPGERRL